MTHFLNHHNQFIQIKTILSMKNVTTLILASFLFTLSLNAQTDFEGIINMKSTAEQGFKGTFTLKGNLVLMESKTEDGQVKILFDEETGDMTTISERNGEKMAVKMNMNNNPYLAQMSQKETYRKDVRSKSAEVIVTDETKMIRGHECVKVIGKDAESEGIAWVAQGLDLNMTDLIPQAKKYLRGHKTMYDFTGVEGFIMEMYMKDLKTGKEVTLENEVIEKAIPDSFFTNLTDGAEVMDMTDMRQMMLDAQQNPEKMRKMKEMMIKMNRE